MKKKKVLFLTHEMPPFIEDTLFGTTVKEHLVALQSKGAEVRSFMPRYGIVNERRNQLHEVLRLSGINIVVNDTDQPLIIKVASIPGTKMQMYFTENEDFFNRKTGLLEADGSLSEDSDEKMLFFSKGTLETTKKSGWQPDIINCNGWLSALAPLFLKTILKDEPIVSKAKVIVTLHNDSFDSKMSTELARKVEEFGFTKEEAEVFAGANYTTLMCKAMEYADAIIIADKTIDSSLIAYAHQTGKPVLTVDEGADVVPFYESLLEEVTV
jgi:starch synthase